MIPRFLPAVALAIAALTAPPASAPATAQASVDGIPFEAYLELLKARARAEGVTSATIERMTAGLTPNERVIRLEGDLSDEQRQRLLEIADKCPVHRTLERASTVTSRLA